MAKDDKDRAFKKSVGRPAKELTPEIQKKICDALRVGNYLETAAAYAGIHKPALYKWIKQGVNNPDGPYGQFNNAVEQARAEGEAWHVNNISEKSEKNWKASAWMLERKNPTRWGSKSAVAVLTKPNDPFDTQEPQDAERPVSEAIEAPQANVVIYIPKNGKEVEPEIKDVIEVKDLNKGVEE